jgi:hypothetical protein
MKSNLPECESVQISGRIECRRELSGSTSYVRRACIVYGWAIKCWECRLLEERERERDGPELAGQYITCYELVDFQRTTLKQQNNVLAGMWKVDGPAGHVIFND